MSLSLSILASGSSGNCSILRAGSRSMLIDCGIGPRTVAGRLKPLGVSLSDLSAICLTHVDSDHFNIHWLTEISHRKIFLYCHENHIDAVLARAKNPPIEQWIRSFRDGEFSPVNGLKARPIGLPHDELGSYAFVFQGWGGCIGYATDLGNVHSELISRFSHVDVLAIESNYDPKMQRESPRPLFLKRRIMGGRGHLSNEQALAAVREILDRAQNQRRTLPRHIVLLHRSRQCNCPRLLHELFAKDRRIAPRLVLAEQDRSTHWLSTPDPSASQTGWGTEQLELQWG
jgi:phosphoribosyl 1,2-cyclic phosphodiesterase